ncbi:ATP-binding protein [Trujillonella humicola]|uniref:ATP-binding protein n=1 Tax=Trujillonella humicola TaxID=3383699 RepID=UPI003906B95A
MDEEWPVWTAPPASAPEVDGYGGIACYVTPLLVQQRIGHAFPRGVRSRFEGAGVDRAGVDRRIAGALWKALAARAIPYTAPPWHPLAGQRIRDPEWLWRTTGSGTCIDLAVLFAGACLNEELATFLVLLRGPATAHAAVAVHLGGNPRSGRLPAGVAATDEPGVGRVVDPAAFAAAPDVLLLDPTTATEGTADASIGHSATTLGELLAGGAFPDVHLVSVGTRHVLGDEPLPQPSRRGALRTPLARPELQATLHFAAHARAWAELRGHTGGCVVLHGREGTGKSTVARQFAAQFDQGFGWVLSGATLGGYRASLARAELAERGDELTVPDAAIEAELARSALDRLARTDGGWVVVVDNANGGPGRLRGLPEPRDGQLLLVTTTDDPAQWPGYLPVGLDRAEGDTDDVPPDLRDVAVGNPLLGAAFAALKAAAPKVVAALPADPVADVDAGARRYWAGVQEAVPGAVALAARLALLPPEAITGEAAAELGPGLDDLVHAGLVTPLTDGTLAMHRVFGRAVRATDGDAAGAAVDVLGCEPARVALARFGDTQVTGVLAQALQAAVDGIALARLGALQELHDGVAVSLATYQRAEAELAPLAPAPGEPAAAGLADCLHARARSINQAREGDVTQEQIEAARAAALRAAGLRGTDELGEQEKHLAMAALLRQRAARVLELGSPELLAELHAVRSELDSSYETRRDLLGPDHPLVDRASFNRAGVRIRLAQAEPDRTAEHLDGAREVYAGTLRFRRAYYSDTSPLTAASALGLGTWGYYAVLYRCAAEPAATFAEAWEHAVESMIIRQRLKANSDVVKSASVLTKLALLQVHLAGGAPAEIADGSITELERGLQR